MKIQLESPSRMVLKDYNIGTWILGLVFLLIGPGVVLLAGTKDLGLVAVVMLFSLVGLAVLVSNKTITVVLDKATGKCSFSFRKILGSESREVNIRDIKEIVLQKLLSTSSGRHGTRTSYKYVLLFSFTDGGGVPLEFGQISAGITDIIISPDEKKKKEAQQVADFAAVPLRFEGPPSIVDTLSAMKEGIEKGIEDAVSKRPQ